MMENKINQNGVKPVYEPVRVQVQQISPTGVLCQSGVLSVGLQSYGVGSEL